MYVPSRDSSVGGTFAALHQKYLWKVPVPLGECQRVSLLRSAPSPTQWKHVLGPFALVVIAKLEEFFFSFYIPFAIFNGRDDTIKTRPKMSRLPPNKPMPKVEKTLVASKGLTCLDCVARHTPRRQIPKANSGSSPAWRGVPPGRGTEQPLCCEWKAGLLPGEQTSSGVCGFSVCFEGTVVFALTSRYTTKPERLRVASRTEIMGNDLAVGKKDVDKKPAGRLK